MNILVHACCGPCSIMPTRLLSQAGHDITVLYANSNIAPAPEYEHRLEELRRYAATQGFPVIEGVYDPDAWERKVAPIGEAIKRYSPAFGKAFAEEATAVGQIAELDSRCQAPATSSTSECAAPSTPADRPVTIAQPASTDHQASIVQTAEADNPASVAELLDDERRRERCRACYRMRLEEAAHTAVTGGFDALTTTLAVSPYQFTDVIHEELERACAQTGIAPYFEDWRPYYDEATRISRDLNMYRQNYCGCRFSIQEGAATRAFVKQQRKLAKAQRQAQRTAEEHTRVQKKAEKQAYADARAKKRAILKALRQSGTQTSS